MKVLFLFVDGLGIGPEDPSVNPCCHEGSGIFHVFTSLPRYGLPFNGVSSGLDATLGLEGLPQSATGQTALLTGENAARRIGRHLSGFPNKALREILLEKSILKKAREMGRRVAFLNAYRPLFFTLPEDTILRLSATTIANFAAKLPFFTLEDIRARKAIYQDFTNGVLLQRGFDVPLFSAKEAAEIVCNAMETYDFVLYEYFRTDRVGHKQDMTASVETLTQLGEFVIQILAGLNLGKITVILTSDHGNIEDISCRGHTRNPAMTLIWGAGSFKIARVLEDLTDVTPAILEWLKHS